MFDYKKVIASRSLRMRVLHCLDWLPDESMVKLQYRIKTGRRLDIEHPQRFTEKLQWLKLRYRDSLMRECANKITVRNYVERKGLSKILLPLLGTYSSPDEIDLSTMPGQFVLKDSLGGGGNEVIICVDKDTMDWADARKTMSEWVAAGRHRKHPGREWVYDAPGPSMILAEEYFVPDNPDRGLMEFKFFCSYGVPSFLYILGNRSLGHSVELGIFKAEDMSRVRAWRCDECRLFDDPPRPGCYEEMLSAACILSAPFPEVRVDFYYAGERQGFRFSEITFFDGSGYFSFDPDVFDYELGATVDLSRCERNLFHD